MIPLYRVTEAAEFAPSAVLTLSAEQWEERGAEFDRLKTGLDGRVVVMGQAVVGFNIGEVIGIQGGPKPLKGAVEIVD